MNKDRENVGKETNNPQEKTASKKTSLTNGSNLQLEPKPPIPSKLFSDEEIKDLFKDTGNYWDK